MYVLLYMEDTQSRRINTVALFSEEADALAEMENAYSRTIEHKHFVFGSQPKTVITREYPEPWNPTRQPYFPVHDEENLALYNSYRALSVTQLDVVFCGRLATFQYYSMDETIRAALDLAAREIK